MGKTPAPVLAEHVLPSVEHGLFLRALLDVDGAGGQAWAWLVERTGGLDAVLADEPRLARHLPALAASAARWEPRPDVATTTRLAEVAPAPATPPDLDGRSPEVALVDVLAATVDDRSPSQHRDGQWVVDAVLLLRAHPDLDWDEVLRLATDRRCFTTLVIQVSHLQDVYAAPAPPRLSWVQRHALRDAEPKERRRLEVWARDDGFTAHPEPSPTTGDLVAKGRRRLRGLVDLVRKPDDALLYRGEGYIPEAARTYPSKAAFIAGVPHRSPVPAEDCRSLVAQDVVDEQVQTWTGPRVLVTLEPPQNRRQGEVLDDPSNAEEVFRFDHPDPERRVHYPALPNDREGHLVRLRADLHRRRPHLVVMVNNVHDHSPHDLEPLRLPYAQAFGHDIDVFGGSGQVSAGWRVLPGCRGPVHDKRLALRSYTCNLAFENNDLPGYITEKILESMLAGCIPLYWGGGGLERDVLPADAYVDCRDLAADELVALVRGMHHDEVVERRRAALAWLESPAADVFTWRAHAARLTAALAAQRT